MPAKINLEMIRGDTFDKVFRLGIQDEDGVTTYTNLSGYTAKMTLKDKALSAVVELTSGAGQITLNDGGNGYIKPTISAATASTLLNDLYFYDLEITSASGIVQTIASGTITFDRQIS